MAVQASGGIDEAPLSLKGKKSGDDEIDITPMIDIVFLLLIFFVVSSKMDPSKTGAFPVAERGLAISSNDSAVIVMERGTGDRAVVKKGDGSLFLDDEEQQRVDIVDYVTQQLDLGKSEVMILGGRTVSVGEIARIQRIIGDGFDNVKTTYIAVKED
jgi:biopolymer transport protein ExbD